MRRSPFETWMFSVVFWILCGWLPCLADWQVSCSRYVVQLWQNICHQNDCEHKWQSIFSPKRTRGKETSRTFWGEMDIVSQIGRYFAWQHLVYQAGNLELNSSFDSQWSWCSTYRCDVVVMFGSFDQPCRSILHRLYLPHEFVSRSIQQQVAVVQTAWNEHLC